MAASASRSAPVTLSRPAPTVAPAGRVVVVAGSGAVVVTVVAGGVVDVVVRGGAVVGGGLVTGGTGVGVVVVVVRLGLVVVVVVGAAVGTRAADGPERTFGPGTTGSAAAKASLPTKPASMSAWVSV